MKEMIKYVAIMLFISTIFLFAAKNANAWGTGHFISNDGYLLTNRHVVDGEIKYKHDLVVHYNNTTYPAKLVYVNPEIDLAVLKIDEQTPCLKIADYHGASLKGVQLTGIFYDFRQSYHNAPLVTKSVTVISEKEFYADRIYKGLYSLVPAYIRPGNSGSPIVNYQNYIVSVFNSGLSIIVQPNTDTILIKHINSGAVSNADLVSVKSHIPQAVCNTPAKDLTSIISIVGE